MLLGLRSAFYGAADLDAAKRWYAEVLGVEPYFDEPFYVGFDIGGYELGLMPNETGHHASWGVADIEAAVAALTGAGATVRDPIADVGGGIRVATLADPHGNPLALIENPHFALPDRGELDSDVLGPVPVVERGARLGADPGDLSERAIVVQRVVNATPAQLWPLWTTAEGVTRWLAEARVELRIGGPFEVHFEDGPEGTRGTEGCRVLSFLHERMLSVTWNAPPSIPETRPQRTWIVVELEPEGAGTRVRISHAGWPASGLADPDSPWSATWSYFEVAWPRVLDALEAHVS